MVIPTLISVTPTLITENQGEYYIVKIVNKDNNPLINAKVIIPEINEEVISDENGEIKILSELIDPSRQAKLLVEYEDLRYESVLGSNSQIIKLDSVSAKTITNQDQIGEINKFIATNIGYLGLFSFGFGLVMVFIITKILLGILITSEFIAPLISSLFLFGGISINKGKVYESFTQNPISFVLIKVYEEDKLIKKAVSNVDGIFQIKLSKGDYIIEFFKKGYLSKKLSFELSNDGYINSKVSLDIDLQNDLSMASQFQVLNAKPIIFIISIVATIAAFINIIYVPNLISISILFLSFILSFIYFRIVPNKHTL